MMLLFVVACVFCVYTYALFPLMLHLRLRWRQKRRGHEPFVDAGTANRVSGEGLGNLSANLYGVDEQSWPAVSIIIAAHNEIANLPHKLASLSELDYPTDKLEIVIVSDGSTDGTVGLLSQVEGLAFEHYEPAAGKPTALNKAVQKAGGEILVFMDARQSVSANAVKALVLRFTDPAVGAVSGELVLSDDGHVEAANVGLYWRYEKWIRQNESELYSTSGATGALYAIRREDATTLPADTLLDDFVTPIEILRKGKRTVFEPLAKAFDRAEADSGREFVRKARTLAGNFQAFARHKWLFVPGSNPIWWQFLSHKVARLLVPYAMLMAFVSSALGDGWFLQVMFWLQVGFYLAGLTAMLVPAISGNKLVNFIKVFIQLNAAAVVGAVRYFSGSSAVQWKSSK